MDWLKVIKWLGLGCILAGLARMGMTPASVVWGYDSVQELSFGLTACILMGITSIAMYMVQSKQTGILGLISVIVIMAGNIITGCILWGYMQYGHYGDEESILRLITTIISSGGVLGGWALLIVMSWLAKVFPRWVVVSMSLMFFSIAIPWTGIFAFFWGLPYVIMGYYIWSGKLDLSHSISTPQQQKFSEVI